MMKRIAACVWTTTVLALTGCPVGMVCQSNADCLESEHCGSASRCEPGKPAGTTSSGGASGVTSGGGTSQASSFVTSSGGSSVGSSASVPGTSGVSSGVSTSSNSGTATSSGGSSSGSVVIPGFDVEALSTLRTTEAGGTALLLLRLRGPQPTADVTVGLTVSNNTEATLSPASVVFTPADFSPRLITVTGLDDTAVDGDVGYEVRVTPASSADTTYLGRGAADTDLVNSDDDDALVEVTPLTGAFTTEPGGPARVRLRLTQPPAQDVRVPFSVSDPTEGSVTRASVTFTSANWGTPQVVTVTGVNDTARDGDVPYVLVLGALTSMDTSFAGHNPPDVALVNSDDDDSRFLVTPVLGLVTSERGAFETFDVAISAVPDAPVTVSLVSSNPLEVTVFPESITFDARDAGGPVRVTLTGVSDTTTDGDQTVVILLRPATSTSALWNGANPPDVSATNLDDVPGLDLMPSVVTITEGDNTMVTVALRRQPTATVTYPVTSLSPRLTLDSNSLSFNQSTWAIPQTLTLTAVEDALVQADGEVLVRFGTPTTNDGAYAALPPRDLEVTLRDNDRASVMVTPPTSPQVQEDGSTRASFTVALNSQPGQAVTLPLRASNAEATLSTNAVVFTTANWNQPVTVYVDAVDDSVDDGDQAFDVILEPTTSLDPAFNTIDPPNLPGLVALDDDTAGILVTPSSGLVTNESGLTATFSVVLRSQPTSTVTVNLLSDTPTEATVAPVMLFFTSMDWDQPQLVTVTGEDDPVTDGAQPYTIEFMDVTALDAAYDALTVPSIPCSNADNDSPGITVSPTAGLSVLESPSSTATFQVVLNTNPGGSVTLSVVSNDPSNATVTPATLQFDATNFAMSQVVTVSGVVDNVDDGPRPVTIVLATTSATPSYQGLNPDDVQVTAQDDDTAGFVVTPLSGLVTQEGGPSTQVTFTVRLASQPTADVVIPLASSRTDEGTASPASLTFGLGTWNLPQTVTVTRVDDPADDDDVTYDVVLGAAVSQDPAYAGLEPPDVSVTNQDNDQAAITVTAPPPPRLTTEAGGFFTFTVVLATRPLADVVIPLRSGNTAEAQVSPSSLTFDAANWANTRTVTVTGANDFVADGNTAFTVFLDPANSADPHFQDLNATDVTGSNQDDDTVGVTVTPQSGLMTSESGGTAVFTVVLRSQPTAPVAISVESADEREGVTNTAVLTFETNTWSTPKQVTVTGVNDAVADGDRAYTVTLGAAVSVDNGYNNLAVPDPTLTNTDNDTAGYTVTPVSGLTVTEGGTTATFTVRLTSQPANTLTMGLSSSDATEATVAPTVLIMDATNWQQPQVVTVTGANDFLLDGLQPFTVVLAPPTGDPVYATLNPPDVTGTTADNDAAGFTVTPVAGLSTSENGTTATFTVVLNTQPSEPVTVGLSSSNTMEGTVAPSSLVFTASDWDLATAHVVTITGADDGDMDGPIAFQITTAPATSADPNYAAQNPPDVSVTNVDNDQAGISVSPTSGLFTSEAGSSMAFFTVTLTVAPTATVTIPVSSMDVSEGTVSTTLLTFTTTNWNMAQQVDVSGANDFVADGNQVFTVLLGATSSADPSFNNLDPPDVTVTNLDDDVAGYLINPSSGLVTYEGFVGGEVLLQVSLTSQPVQRVTVYVTSTPASEVTGADMLMFDSMNWSTPQVVTLSGVNDDVDDGDRPFLVQFMITTTDPVYANLDPADVPGSNVDDDTAGYLVNMERTLFTHEGGGMDSFTIRLTSEPTATVNLTLTSSDVTEGTVAPGALSFTASNWSMPRAITVTGVDDALADGDVNYNVVINAATSDPVYQLVGPPSISVINTDNDYSSILVSPQSLQTTEGGTGVTFTISLTAQPSANVTIGLESQDTSEGTVSPASVTFTNQNWMTAQVVTVTPVNDTNRDGDVTFAIITQPATSTDPAYSNQDAPDVVVENRDNERLMFVTSSTFTGNLGGISGADSICSSSGYGMFTSFKAVLAGGGRAAPATAPDAGMAGMGVDWPLKPLTSYVRPDDTFLFTTNAQGLIPFNTSAAPSPTGPAPIFTGLNSNWTTGQDCMGWTLGGPGGGFDGGIMAFGSVGAGHSTTNSLINQSIAACSTPAALLCAEQ